MVNVNMRANWFKKRARQKKALTFCLRPDGVSMAEADEQGKLLHCDYIPLDVHMREDQLFPALVELVSRYSLEGRCCRWVLAPGQYQLLMTDKLKVPDDEIRDALRWRMKGLLEHSPEETTLDVFPVPLQGVGIQQEKVFAVASHTSLLQKRIELFEKAFLKVNCIDISDLAMRNIMTVYPQNDVPIVMLSLDHGVCKIILCYQADIYLIRQLALNLSVSINENKANVLDAVLLEIQRSVDYSLSELKLALPQQLLLTPRLAPYRELHAHLKQNLDMEITLLDLNHCLESVSPISQEVQENCLNSLGCAMYPMVEHLLKEAADATN